MQSSSGTRENNYRSVLTAGEVSVERHQECSIWSNLHHITNKRLRPLWEDGVSLRICNKRGRWYEQVSDGFRSPPVQHPRDGRKGGHEVQRYTEKLISQSHGRHYAKVRT